MAAGHFGQRELIPLHGIDRFIREMIVKRLFWLAVALVVSASVATACGNNESQTVTAANSSVLPVVNLRGVDNKGAGLEAGTRAPDFALEFPDGSRTTLSDLRGQPVVLNFWATWCPPCRAEMPDLVAAYEAHKDNGLVIVGVNEQDDEDKALAFMEQYGIEFPVLLDSRGDLASLYTARGLPTTFFIDRDGNVAEAWSGMLTADLLDERLQLILEN